MGQLCQNGLQTPVVPGMKMSHNVYRKEHSDGVRLLASSVRTLLWSGQCLLQCMSGSEEYRQLYQNESSYNCSGKLEIITYQ